MIFLLREMGAKTNFQFKHKRPKQLLETEKDRDERSDKEKPYFTTPLLHLIANVSLTNDTRDNEMLKTMIQMGSDVSEQDSNGKDAIMMAIELNDEVLVSLLLHHIKDNKVKHNQDMQKKSAVHWVVWPFIFGSYENVKILDMLLKAKFHYDLKDSTGKTPLDLALMQESGKMIQVFKNHGIAAPKQHFQRLESIIPSNQWGDSDIHYE
jgi:ankyrin repeat protein